MCVHTCSPTERYTSYKLAQVFVQEQSDTGVRRDESWHEDKSVCKNRPVLPTLVQVIAQVSVVRTAEQEKTSLNIKDHIS